MGDRRTSTTRAGSQGTGRTVDQHALRRAVLRAVAYADVFSFAQTPSELHRYLIGVAATPGELDAALGRDEELRSTIVRKDGLIVFRGREELVERRRGRQQLTRELWSKAVRYGRSIAALPFVEMVAMTGAVAVGNPEPDADLDYLVVTRPGRLWSARGFTIGLVRLAARDGVELCPNYLLAADALALDERDLFTAHELAQMVPLSGFETYRRMRDLNRWADELLPNAVGPPPRTEETAGVAPLSTRWAERLLAGATGAVLERWEMGRKVRKLAAQAEPDSEVQFSATACKGHFHPYGQRVMEAYEERLAALNGSGR